MSPEQTRGKTVDKRTDIWAFAVVLHEMVTGRRPFAGDDLTETLASVVKDQPDLNQAPEQLRKLLAKCLEKNPRERLRDIGDAWALVDDSRNREHRRAATVEASVGRGFVDDRCRPRCAGGVDSASARDL
jgi:serine/threonine protein kinase